MNRPNSILALLVVYGLASWAMVNALRRTRSAPVARGAVGS